MNKLYLRFCFLDDLLKIHFFIFINIDDEKERKFNSSSVFEEFYLNLRKNFGNSWTQVILDKLNTQKVELHTNPCWSYQTISLVCRYIYIYIYVYILYIIYIYIIYIYIYPTQNNQWSFCTVEQKATIVSFLEVILK